MKKLYLSHKDKKLAGVLGGLAEYFAMDSTFFRVVFLFIFIFTGVVPGIIFYVLAALIIPREPESAATTSATQ